MQICLFVYPLNLYKLKKKHPNIWNSDIVDTDTLY